MYTDSIARTFLRLATFTNWLGCSPYRVDRVLGKIYIHFWSHFRTIHVWSWFTAYAIIVLPTHLYILHTTGQTRRFNFTLIILGGCCMCSILLGVLTFKTLGVLQIVNAVFKFLPDFKDKYLSDYDYQKDNFRNKLLEIFLLLVYVSITVLGVGGAIDSCIRPFAAPYLLFNIDPHFVTWPWYIITCGWYGSFGIGFTSVLGLLAYTGILYFAYSLPIIRQELRTGQKTYKTSDFLRKDPHHLIITWRTMQYITRLINIELGFCLLYIQGTIKSMLLVCAVTLVYQWNSSGILIRGLMMFGGIFGALIWCVVLTLAGFQYSWSKETIESWKREYWLRKEDWRYIERFKMSCRPLSVGDGKRYHIQPVTMLRFLNGLSKNTFTALITYGDFMGYT